MVRWNKIYYLDLRFIYCCNLLTRTKHGKALTESSIKIFGDHDRYVVGVHNT